MLMRKVNGVATEGSEHNQEIIKTWNENENDKDTGIMNQNLIKQNKMKEKVNREYFKSA